MSRDPECPTGNPADEVVPEGALRPPVGAQGQARTLYLVRYLHRHIAANAMYGALVIGPRQPFAPRAAEWQWTLSAFAIDLSRAGRLVDRGDSGNVLGGPLSALCHLTGLLASDPVNLPLSAGEIVSTGTLTKAMPIIPGELWAATPAGIALDAIQLRFS